MNRWCGRRPVWGCTFLLIPAGIILGGTHLVGLVTAILVWQGHNVRLSLFARWAERRRSRV